MSVARSERDNYNWLAIATATRKKSPSSTFYGNLIDDEEVEVPLPCPF